MRLASILPVHQFQSLFWWNTSIELCALLRLYPRYCFNPCSGGIPLLTHRIPPNLHPCEWFQSLFWWNTSIEGSGTTALMAQTLFQSLFWWNTSIDHRSPPLFRHSIGFQSLFWWNTSIESTRPPESKTGNMFQSLFWWNTSIDAAAAFESGIKIAGFNPCSGGIPLLKGQVAPHGAGKFFVSILVLVEYLY